MGDVFPCGRFVGHDEFTLGNINDNSITEIFSNQRLIDFQNRENFITSCGSCSYNYLCNSGCPYEAFVQYNSILEKTYLCEAYQLIFSHVESKICKLNYLNEEIRQISFHG
jgi:uncharacterized protein